MILFRVVLAFLIMFTASDSIATDVAFKNTREINGETLTLNGAGFRTFLGFKMYSGALYLKAKSKNSPEIINGDFPMAVSMIIISSLITGEKLEKSTLEGFQKSTNKNCIPIELEIKKFVATINENLLQGDAYDFVYFPNVGTEIIKNGESKTIIKGLPFKKALFGIWLGGLPAQNELKNKMLGL
jgi:hypothetical protein